MKDHKFVRKDNQIMTMKDASIETFTSINKAKRKSRALQFIADGALGRGTVRKVK